ncbi:MAG: DUF262 domain-containing protein [Salinibacter sp.]
MTHRTDDKTVLFKRTDYSLTKLIQDIDFGDISLPDLQRPFVWKPFQVRDLFDSMFRGFPVGYLVLWANDGMNQAERTIGVQEKSQPSPRLLIIDGQQRLTAIYAIFKGQEVMTKDFRPKKLRIAFRPIDGTFEVTDAAIDKDPEFLSDLSAVFSEESSYTIIESYFNRISTKREIGEDEKQQIIRNIEHLFSLKNYPFTALEIASNVPEEQAAEIFVRINSQGVDLGQADFILTLLSVFWEDGRRALENFCQACRQPPTKHDKPSPYNHFIEPEPDQLLRVAIGLGFRRGRLKHVYSLLRGKDLETGEFSDDRRESQFQILRDAQEHVLDVQNWHNFHKALLTAGFRSGDMISSDNTLLFSYIFYLIGTVQFAIPQYELQLLIGRWYFMASITGRYTSSPETALDRDLARIRDLQSAEEFQQRLEQIMADNLTNDFWQISLPNFLDSSSATNPALYAYYAALNRLGTRVLFSQKKVNELFDPTLNPRKKALERHHLFPRNYLQKLGIEDTQRINQIANYALLEYPDNIDISDQPPAEYFPDLINRYEGGNREEMMKDHALWERWWELPYDEFLQKRRQRIADVIRRGFEGLR